MYSVQRRHERYKIIYIYKIKEKLVQNISVSHGLQFSQRRRLGCVCRVPSYPLYHNKAVIARNNSFALTASSLWNSLPKHIRDISGVSVDAFKRRLDNTLKIYPDEPRCSSNGCYTDMHGRSSNSITDLSRNRDLRRLLSVPAMVPEGGPPGWPSSN